jgi:sulfur-carrier protein
VARIRLFGPAADAAGRTRDELPGHTVDQVLGAARDLYGTEFAEILSTCRVWVNGDDPEPGLPLAEGDEVAVLPPVSGGCR